MRGARSIWPFVEIEIGMPSISGPTSDFSAEICMTTKPSGLIRGIICKNQTHRAVVNRVDRAAELVEIRLLNRRHILADVHLSLVDHRAPSIAAG